MRKSQDFPQPPDDEQDGAAEGGPDSDEELTPGQEEDGAGDDDTAAADRLADKLDIFGARMAARRDEWVRARASQGHDRRWVEDVDQYNGMDSANRSAAQMMTSVEQGFPVTTQHAKAMRSTVFVQVTRQKTNSMAARWADIVCPADDPNFGVQATPTPDLPSFVHVPSTSTPAPAGAAPGAPPEPQLPPAATPGAAAAAPAGASPIGGPQPAQGMDGAPAAGAAPGGPPGPAAGPAPAGPPPPPPEFTPEQQKAMAEKDEAKRRADAMQQEILDCFTECDVMAEERRVIFDASLFGAGVLKGPVVINRTRKAWNKRVDVMGRPSWSMEVVQELHPASFRIDPRRFYPDPQCGESLQNGRGCFEFDKKTSKQVRDLAKQPAYIRAQLERVLEEGPTVGRAPVIVGEREDRDVTPGEVFEHWIYWGEVDREDLIAAGVKISDDELEVTSACIEMLNSTVVRAYINPLADGELPYDITPCERIPGSVWGYGVPYLMRAQQRVINAAWRMILDNAGVSSGPQIVMKPGAIYPADKQMTLTSRKIWYAQDDVEDVRKAFTTFEFASHQAELSAIIEMADRLSDQETAVPMLAQGQQGSAPETVGGMQILMQGANVMLRRLVKQFDDCLIKPHVRRYYNYLMEYSPKEEIKGDFMVAAVGSSALITRDVQNQFFQNLLQLAPNPAYAPLINLKKLFVKALQASHVEPHDVMNTDAEIAAALDRAAKAQQPDPRILAAQMVKESTDMRTQAMEKMNQADNLTRQQIADRNAQAQQDAARMANEAALNKIEASNQHSLNTAKAQLASTAIKVRADQDMHANELMQPAEPAGAA